MIGILNYKCGNIRSIQNMLKKIGLESILIDSVRDLAKSKYRTLPGVGKFDYGMSQIKNSSLLSLIEKKIFRYEIPTLGICLGMQLMTFGSEEGVADGLGWVDAKTVKFKFGPNSNARIPHMGWNKLSRVSSLAQESETNSNSRFYFVLDFPGFARYQIALKCNSMRGVYERQTVYR